MDKIGGGKIYYVAENIKPLNEMLDPTVSIQTLGFRTQETKKGTVVIFTRRDLARENFIFKEKNMSAPDNKIHQLLTLKQQTEKVCGHLENYFAAIGMPKKSIEILMRHLLSSAAVNLPAFEVNTSNNKDYNHVPNLINLEASYILPSDLFNEESKISLASKFKMPIFNALESGATIPLKSTKKIKSEMSSEFKAAKLKLADKNKGRMPAKENKLSLTKTPEEQAQEYKKREREAYAAMDRQKAAASAAANSQNPSQNQPTPSPPHTDISGKPSLSPTGTDDTPSQLLNDKEVSQDTPQSTLTMTFAHEAARDQLNRGQMLGAQGNSSPITESPKTLSANSPPEAIIKQPPARPTTAQEAVQTKPPPNLPKSNNALPIPKSPTIATVNKSGGTGPQTHALPPPPLASTPPTRPPPLPPLTPTADGTTPKLDRNG